LSLLFIEKGLSKAIIITQGRLGRVGVHGTAGVFGDCVDVSVENEDNRWVKWVLFVGPASHVPHGNDVVAICRGSCQ
jgi:hypothetical protein